MINIHDQILAFIAENKDNDETKNNYVDKIESDMLPRKKVDEYKKTEESINKVIKYSGKFFFNILDNRKKDGALWVYHDRDNTLHAIYFERMGMKYKSGRGWWIK